jgi:hypothetical protein
MKLCIEFVWATWNSFSLYTTVCHTIIVHRCFHIKVTLQSLYNIKKYLLLKQLSHPKKPKMEEFVYFYIQYIKLLVQEKRRVIIFSVVVYLMDFRVSPGLDCFPSLYTPLGSVCLAGHVFLLYTYIEYIIYYLLCFVHI